MRGLPDRVRGSLRVYDEVGAEDIFSVHGVRVYTGIWGVKLLEIIIKIGIS